MIDFAGVDWLTILPVVFGATTFSVLVARQIEAGIRLLLKLCLRWRMSRNELLRVEILKVSHMGGDEFVVYMLNRSERPVTIQNPKFEAYGMLSAPDESGLEKIVIPDEIETAFAHFPGIGREYIGANKCKLIDTGYSKKQE